VDAWQVETWEAYRDVARLGRKTRLPESRRAALWQIFSSLRDQLAAENLATEAAVFTRLANHIAATKLPFDHAIIDEAQDLGVAQLRFFASLGGNRPDASSSPETSASASSNNPSPGSPSAWIFAAAHAPFA
jgi:hypothetical protein